MHLRRAILLFALVLGLTALAAAVSPSRNDGDGAGDGGAVVAPAPSVSAADALPRQIVLDTRRPRTRSPKLLRARTNEHVVVSVIAARGGLATIPDLGRTATVSAAPARFDLLAPEPGRYDVVFEAAGAGEPRRVGTLVTRP